MELNCPNCAATINSDQININQLIAKCDSCHHVFRFDNMVPAKSEPEPMPVPQPQNVRVNNDLRTLTFEWRWFGSDLIFLIIFTIFWNGFILSFLPPNISALREGNILALSPVLMLPHTWIGLFLLYYVLARIINKTQIILDDHELKVKQGPLPWLGNRTVRRNDIAQFYVNMFRSNKGRRSYQLNAVLTNGKQQKILSKRSDSSIPLYVAQELESFMGIENRPVQGEYTGTEPPFPSLREIMTMFKKESK